MLPGVLIWTLFTLAEPSTPGPLHFPSPLLWESAVEGVVAAPVVADVHDRIGSEILVAASHPTRMVCLDRLGQPLWSADLPAAPKASPSVSANALLAVATERGIVCLDPATGRHRWEKDIPGMTVYPPVWADLNYDDVDELLIPSESGLIAVDVEGETLWRYPEDSEDSAAPVAPLVAMDADQDGKSEVYLLMDDLLICIEADGFERWQAQLQPGAKPGHLIGADLDGDSRGEVYAAANNRLLAYDAAFGDELGTLEMEEPVVALIAADLDRDGQGELVAAHASGAVAIYHMEGRLHLFEHKVDTPSSVLAADVNGDTELDILVAGRGVAAIFGIANFDIPAPAAAGAALADLNGDGSTVLVTAAPAGISAWEMPGPWWTAFQHWPQPRNDAAQRGAWWSTRVTRDAVVRLSSYEPALDAAPDLALVQSTAQLLADGGFDDSKWTERWKVEGDTDRPALDTIQMAAGAGSLRIAAGEGNAVLTSAAMPVAPEVRSVSAGLLMKGDTPIEARLIWRRNGMPVAEHSLERLSAQLPGGWTRYNLNSVTKSGFPASALDLVLSIEVPPLGSEILLDEVQVNANIERIPVVELLVNQVSYEIVSPKIFVARCNFEARDASFKVLDTQGHSVYSGRFLPAERITGAYQNDWGAYFFRGDFSGWDQEGGFYIEAQFDGLTVRSAPFAIQFNGIWERTIDSAVEFFLKRRPPEDAPPTALWIAGENDADPVLVAWDLICSFDAASVQFRKRAAEGTQPLLLEEILWAGERLRAGWAAEPKPGPASLYAAIFARLLRLTGSDEAWRAVAEEALSVANTQEGLQELRFSAALDLYLKTREPAFAELSHALYPGASIVVPESITYYDGEFENLATFELAGHFATSANAWLKRARSSFGVCTQGDAGGNYFATPAEADGKLWGNSAYILEAAAAVAKAYRFNPRPEYLAFMHDQFNWILGANPASLCLMAGQGELAPPAFAETPIDGGIVNGIRGLAPGVDVPAFDAEASARSNGFSLRANAAWISALANLKRIPSAQL